MSKNKKQILFPEVLKLLIGGASQKEISFKLGVTEKTISKWLKEIKESSEKNKEKIIILESKLKILLLNENSSSIDIKNITTAILNLENRWFHKISNNLKNKINK